MKIIVLFSLVILSACVTPTPIPQEIKNQAAQIPADNLPKNFHLEKNRCPKYRYHSFNKRMACKEEVRRELAARKLMREQTDALKQENTKEQNNEAIKN